MASFFEIDHLSKRFGGLLAVDDVSFSVNQGEIYTIIGPNGAGKTTIFNLISLIYPASAGQIHFQGRALGEMSPDQVVRLGIGRTFQNIELFAQATVLQNLLIGRHAHTPKQPFADMLFTRSVRQSELENRRAVEQVIDFLELAAYRDATVSGLPYGVRKVVELARALCTGPKLLLLDEPSSGLNVEETDDMAYWIQDIRDELGITVLMVEHDMSLVSRVSDRVLAVNFGKVLAEGTPAEVQAHPDVIAAYLGQT
jgi:branched-chain amino acid transport system ATP-binding protein